MNKLSPKQQAFADRYLETSNATQSYIDAGYKCEGKAAEAGAAQVLGNIKVAEYIESKKKKLSEKSEWNRERLVKEFESIHYGGDTAPKDQIAALREIGRLVGAYDETLNVKHDLSDPLLEIMKRVRRGE